MLPQMRREKSRKELAHKHRWLSCKMTFNVPENERELFLQHCEALCCGCLMARSAGLDAKRFLFAAINIHHTFVDKPFGSLLRASEAIHQKKWNAAMRLINEEWQSFDYLDTKIEIANLCKNQNTIKFDEIANSLWSCSQLSEREMQMGLILRNCKSFVEFVDKKIKSGVLRDELDSLIKTRDLTRITLECFGEVWPERTLKI